MNSKKTRKPLNITLQIRDKMVKQHMPVKLQEVAVPPDVLAIRKRDKAVYAAKLLISLYWLYRMRASKREIAAAWLKVVKELIRPSMKVLKKWRTRRSGTT